MPSCGRLRRLSRRRRRPRPTGVPADSAFLWPRPIGASSINLLKEVELARSRPKPSSTDAFPKSDFLEEDDDDEIGNVTLSHLCGDLLEEIADDDSDYLSCDFRTVVKKIRLYL